MVTSRHINLGNLLEELDEKIWKLPLFLETSYWYTMLYISQDNESIWLNFPNEINEITKHPIRLVRYTNAEFTKLVFKTDMEICNQQNPFIKFSKQSWPRWKETDQDEKRFTQRDLNLCAVYINYGSSGAVNVRTTS